MDPLHSDHRVGVFKNDSSMRKTHYNKETTGMTGFSNAQFEDDFYNSNGAVAETLNSVGTSNNCFSTYGEWDGGYDSKECHTTRGGTVKQEMVHIKRARIDITQYSPSGNLDIHSGYQNEPANQLHTSMQKPRKRSFEVPVFPVRCVDCNLTFRDPFVAARHTAITHRNEHVFECVRCFAIASSLEDADNHLKRSHGLRVPFLDPNEPNWDWTVWNTVMNLLLANDIELPMASAAQTAIIEKYRNAKDMSKDSILRKVYIPGPYLNAVKVKKVSGEVQRNEYEMPQRKRKYDQMREEHASGSNDEYSQMMIEEDSRFIQQKYRHYDLFKYLHLTPDLLAMASDLTLSFFNVLYCMYERGLLKIFKNGRIEVVKPWDTNHEDILDPINVPQNDYSQSIPPSEAVDEFRNLLKSLPEYHPPKKQTQVWNTSSANHKQSMFPVKRAIEQKVYRLPNPPKRSHRSNNTSQFVPEVGSRWVLARPPVSVDHNKATTSHNVETFKSEDTGSVTTVDKRRVDLQRDQEGRWNAEAVPGKDAHFPHHRQ